MHQNDAETTSLVRCTADRLFARHTYKAFRLGPFHRTLKLLCENFDDIDNRRGGIELHTQAMSDHFAIKMRAMAHIVTTDILLQGKRRNFDHNPVCHGDPYPDISSLNGEYTPGSAVVIDWEYVNYGRYYLEQLLNITEFFKGIHANRK